MSNPNSPSPASGTDGPRSGRRDAVGSYERLLDGAQAVFAERGYRAANVNEICARSRVGIGTFYANFDHKRELLKHVFLARATLFSNIVTSDDLLDHDRLVACLGAAVDDATAAGLLRAWYEAVLEEPEIAHFHAQWRPAALKGLAATVAVAQQRAPSAGARLEPGLVAWAFGTLGREMAIHDRRGAPDLDGLARLLEELAFGPIRAAE